MFLRIPSSLTLSHPVESKYNLYRQRKLVREWEETGLADDVLTAVLFCIMVKEVAQPELQPESYLQSALFPSTSTFEHVVHTNSRFSSISISNGRYLIFIVVHYTSLACANFTRTVQIGPNRIAPHSGALTVSEHVFSSRQVNPPAKALGERVCARVFDVYTPAIRRSQSLVRTRAHSHRSPVRDLTL